MAHVPPKPATGPDPGMGRDFEPAVEQAATGQVPNDGVEAAGEFPCSVGQERFWLLDRLGPGNPAYNVAVRWRLEGRISRQLIEDAWNRILQRHEVLRSIFNEVDGRLVQRVCETASIRLPEIDLSKLGAEDRLREGDRIGMIEARAPFDLQTGPLIRITLLRLDTDAAIILITTHQIVSDGWSIGVMAREMGVIYDALLRGVEPELEELAIQYGDYSRWQTEWLRAHGGAAESEYWTRQLAGVRTFAVTPDYPRPSLPTTNGAIASIVLPREVTDRAQRFASEQGVTLYVVAVAMLAATLARYANRDEVVLGTQVSDRDQVELEPMIGQFVSSLILRCALDADPSFAELCHRLADTCGQAIEHRHIPIETLLSLVKAGREAVNSAAVSVNFIFQRTFIKNTTYRDFSLIDMPSLPAGAIYDLNFFMVEREDGWRFSCQYNTDEFDGATPKRLLHCCQNVLDAGSRDPSLRLADLPLEESGVADLPGLPPEAEDHGGDATPAATIRAMARVAPDQPALSDGGGVLTRGALERRADTAAALLVEAGVAAGHRIALALDASCELVIVLLGVLKAGASFIVLDRRDAALAADAADWIVGDEAFLQSVDGHAGRSLDIARIRTAWQADSVTAPVDLSVATAPACELPIANGIPQKGRIAVSNGTLARTLAGIAALPGVSAGDVVFVATHPTHARWIIDVLSPLSVGARVVLARPEPGKASALAAAADRCGATVIAAPVTVVTAAAAAGWASPRPIRFWLDRAGLTPAVGDALARLGQVFSLFGAVGAGVWNACARVAERRSFEDAGVALDGCRLEVVDTRGRRSALGATGEIVVLAPGGMHRTGDEGRRRTGGEIEYLGTPGRWHVEQGIALDLDWFEERALAEPIIRAVAAISRVAPDGTPALELFVEAARSDVPPGELAGRVRAALESVLPHDVLPRAIVLRDALPRTASGMIDRRALRAPESSTAQQSVNPVVEAGLTDLWKSFLGQDSIDPNLSFFELGGHSLLAARMLAQVEKKFGRRLTLATLFRAPTIRALAQVITDPEQRGLDFRQVVKLNGAGTKVPIVAINNTGVFYTLAKRMGPDQPIICLQLFDPSLPAIDLPQTLEALAARYVELLRATQAQGPYRLGGWCVAGALAFEIARQLEQAGQVVAQLILFDAWIPNYLSRLPWPRSWVNDYSLRLNIIYDEWREVLAGRKTFREFLEARRTVKRFTGSGADREADAVGDPEDRKAADEWDHDLWVLHYLQRLTRNYEPSQYEGGITLIRSDREPTGIWFDPEAGWGPYARGGVKLVIVPGDHFSMFQEPGASGIAAAIGTGP